MELSQIKRIVEAALLASAQPLSLPQLAALFTESEAPTHEDLARSLEQLTDECAERGIELKEVASGFRYQVRQDVHTWIARLWTERQTKYSRALLETLSLIAYRQPITRGEISSRRSRNANGSASSVIATSRASRNCSARRGTSSIIST
jgi:segregation and condensation protein B